MGSDKSPSFAVYVDGTDSSISYRGRLEPIQCACCPQHTFWWHEGMVRVCDYCLNDEDAGPRWNYLKSQGR